MALPPVPAPVAFIQERKIPPHLAAEAAYLSYMPEYFKNEVWLLNKIRSKVSKKFGVAIHQTYICGSAQFGYSYVKKRPFMEGESDLDMAIIDAKLFSEYYDFAAETTNSFFDQTKFDSVQDRNLFLKYISTHGMIRPDLLPRCTPKQLWKNFFDSLSWEYRKHFKSISCAIYLSETAFIFKQASCIQAARGE